MKFLKILLYIIGSILFILLIMVATMVTTIDRTPYKEMSYYKQWKENVGKITNQPVADTLSNTLSAGWAKVNITPATPGPMAGYGKRRGKHYEAVHDSVYVRTIIIENGVTKAAIITADMLIVPPNITARVKELLPATGFSFDQVYFGAIHSHNSLGGWYNTITGKLFAGPYDAAVVETVSQAIIKSINDAKKNIQPATIGFGEVKDTIDIKNRLVGDEGIVDPWVRNLEITSNNGQKAMISSYAAHSTILNASTMELSRDWAGALVDDLESREANFAVYMAGAVGSMAPIEKGKDDFDEVKNQAGSVEKSIQTIIGKFEKQPAILRSVTVALPLRDPRPKIMPNLALRSWVFRWAFGDVPSYMKALRIGNILMVGTPCDFSGELMPELTAYAAKKGLHLMVTSFNGGYVGYITNDKYFDRDLYETKTMSWFGPYNGAYFQEAIKDLIDKMS
ncbi:neutral/alkaline non-lysosomal ceramidase N-terminal domain-containing protein [Dyadobacter subterraneus]|uniref:Neutral/alkaline non-lysosomal ceramidase N-terminal domain-containing protein n=1 Tax=Dyadobacter subterraneus TaxID=2773304 RepID=A0ABR9WIP9_9BACT|nr:neutral/alkaline non-lysosomal ceramidase N-terminal domain-containing protein [Dyadobacter subterraneus]MBE9465287.1 neutral/alkaline non-lysosomal ceramidase N-terminal domain-containing protein [Dyadobacter subterraneus]